MSAPRFFVFDDLVRILVTGRHRARFLHAMTTSEVQKLAPGDATFALLSTANGRHVGQLRLEVEPDALSLVTRATSLEPIVETLKKHKVADDVRFGERVPGEATLAIYGDARGLEDLVGALPAAGKLASGAWRVTAWDKGQSELGTPMFEVRGDAARIAELAETLGTRGLSRLDDRAWHAARIAHEWPHDGLDLGPDDSALVSDRLLATVSWKKGCFLGQEVFVMARDRGTAPKKLCRLVLSSGTWSLPGSALGSIDGTDAGVLGSSAGAEALAILKRKAAEPGTVVRVTNGGVATVASRHNEGLQAVSEPA